MIHFTFAYLPQPQVDLAKARPGTQPRSLPEAVGTHVHESSPANSKVCISRKLEQEQSPGWKSDTPIWDADIPSSNLTFVSNVCLYLSFSKGAYTCFICCVNCYCSDHQLWPGPNQICWFPCVSRLPL